MMAEKDAELAAGYRLLESSAAERSKLRSDCQAAQERMRDLQIKLTAARAQAGALKALGPARPMAPPAPRRRRSESSAPAETELDEAVQVGVRAGGGGGQGEGGGGTRATVAQWLLLRRRRIALPPHPRTHACTRAPQELADLAYALAQEMDQDVEHTLAEYIPPPSNGQEPAQLGS